MIPRVVCLDLPPPQARLSITIPGVGSMSNIGNFALEAYDVCAEARHFLAGIQPVFGALGMPLCILSCVSSITELFTSDFPFIDPTAIARMAKKCVCLASFTPFGFCGMIRGLLAAIMSVLNCMVGLLGDILVIESQAIALMLDPVTAATAQCMQRQASVLRQTLGNSFGPVSELLDSTKFLFDFVGVDAPTISSVTGSNTAEMIQVVQQIMGVLQIALNALNVVCP